jgi:dipicolinate synthase subunit A
LTAKIIPQADKHRLRSQTYITSSREGVNVAAAMKSRSSDPPSLRICGGGGTVRRRILEGKTIALLGGDEREVILAQALLDQGARLLLVGYDERPRLAQAIHCDLLSAVQQADTAVAPMSNTDAEGRIKATLDPTAELWLDDAVFAALAGKTLFIGMAKPLVQELAGRHDVRIVETAEIDEIAVLNSIPTAEGAILRAMTELPTTVHGSSSLVVGFGRCGITLARMLHGLGARVVVAARNRAQLARAYEMGLAAIHLDDISQAVQEVDVVYNTVPALVLTEEVIEALPQRAIIVDIASAPGGTDFVAARRKRIKAFLDLGIPGKVAPQTAGEILARTMPRLIADLDRR